MMDECNFKRVQKKREKCILTNAQHYVDFMYDCPGEENCILFQIYKSRG